MPDPMTYKSVSVTEADRSPAQFFFEVGYGACFAEALIRNSERPPFPLTDALVERAWEIAGEVHDDPNEFDRYLTRANAAASTAAASPAREPTDAATCKPPLQVQPERVAGEGAGMVITGQIGPCQHQWSYMPTTGAVSCIRCNAFRAYDTPEAETTRKAYETALSTPAPASAAEQPADLGERYGADRFTWAAPGDQQEDAWLVRFCDKDCREALFTGPDAEQEAWEHYDRYAPAYNLFVFRLARLTAAPDHPRPAVGEIERLREALNSAVGVLTMIRRGVSSQAYDLTGCIERGQSALSTTAPVDQHTGEG